jgi:hypothetical protein
MIGLFARVGWERKGSIRYLSGYSWLRTEMERRNATLVVETTAEVKCVKYSHTYL